MSKTGGNTEEQPAWTPDTTAQNQCSRCGGHVDENFRRVFGDNQGRVHACLNCADKTALAEAATERDQRDSYVARGSSL